MDVTAALPRSRRTALAVVLAALLALPLSGSGALGGSSTVAGPQHTFVLRVDNGTMSSVTDRVQALGGTVTRRLHGVGVAVVRLSSSAADSLRATRGVLAVTPDSEVRLLSYSAGSDTGSAYNVAQVTGAKRAWSSGITGAGVDVAVIDSGVTPVAGLDSPGKIVNGPDLSFESQNPSTRYLDTYGHGTFMAGLIAGNDGYVGKSDYYTGMAPNARIISLKVADARGATDVSQVIAAIDWVVQHRKDPGMNIRVLNLSFGTPSLQSYLLDPLAYAAEVAWRKGVVVVVSAGNDGTGTGKLLNPAQDPYVLAVGAEDSKGTPSIGDDTVPDFSTRGDGIRNPDVVAPGTSLQGLRVPGSYVDAQYGGSAAFEGRYFRGSGTSQAAAVVSGLVALLLEQRPGLTPDQVKELLTRTATGLPVADRQAQGNGLVDLNAALWTSTPTLAKQAWPLSTGTGSIDAARGAAKLVLNGVTLNGERDIFGQAVKSGQLASQAMAENSWNGGTWNGSSWAGSSWAGSSWAGSSWAGSSWAGSSWAGSSWATGVWDGSSWAGSSWAGSSWAGSSWAGSSWAGSSWANGVWAGGKWG